MTKLKGCLSICALCIVVGGVFYAFISSQKGVRIRHSDENSSRRHPESSQNLENDDRIVVPETVTLTDQRGTDHSLEEEEDHEPRVMKEKPKEEEQSIKDSAPSPSGPSHVMDNTTSAQKEKVEEQITSKSVDYPSPARILNFDPYGLDSLVVIHIQKTGGSDFLRHMITATRDGRYLCLLPDDTQTDIQNNSVGHKGITGRGIMCPRDPDKPSGEQWLVCEKNLGWICQLHTSFSEYKVCLPKLTNPKVNPKSNFHYSVILRHPVLRYLSEYLHFQRNATWAKRRVCGGKQVTDAEMPPCYPGFYEKKPWPNMTIDKFLSCKSNWANNRQTRMLTDLESIGCYGNTLHPPEEKDRLMLASAKNNLRDFAFFGLTEYQNASRALFEYTFDVKLKLKAEQRALSSLHSAPILQRLWNNSKLYERIATVNKLDMQLYEYALQLFAERVKSIGFEIDQDVVSKEIESMKPDDSRKKFKRLNLHEFES